MEFTTDDLLQRQICTSLEQDLFYLAIQPILDFQTGEIFTGEALARLDHPEYGVISAEVFTSILDDAGLYSEFDLYIFRKCCLWLELAAKERIRFDHLFCNFSRKTLSRPGLPEKLIQIATSCGVPPGKLGIEITEGKQATNIGQMIRNLKQLKSAGFQIILDDYGSGVTSGNDLLNFPLDVVKLDHSLLLNADTSSGETAFRALVSKLIRLGVKVVCEGIETEAQDILARQTGCHYGQGFHYYCPLPQDSLLELLQ